MRKQDIQRIKKIFNTCATSDILIQLALFHRQQQLDDPSDENEMSAAIYLENCSAKLDSIAK